tara:strand:- start:1340 stop:1501 length:162 start_codon:yes stop_codon:yes gene_type:complete
MSEVVSQVDRLIVLVHEIAILKGRYTDHDTGHLRTAVRVLEDRVKEIKEKINV